MTDPVENPWFALNVLLEYYDTIERLAIRDASIGGLGKDLIISGDLDSFNPSVKHTIIRQEWRRLNTMTPTLTSLLTRG